ncbi:CCA tRNA nucleotidyltransferase [Feifania hominis]|uniref:CCA tRNA nucleotidyltransferase n=1 Tax=Feifania hominis TaxID=2763660 RepID=UPI00201604F7|nr:HD domain-containing protein [Feifania hominis]
MFSIPDGVRQVLGRLTGLGFEAHLVGGCVRDLLMGREPHDFDVATSALPEQVKCALCGLRVIETGLRHGTVTALAGGQAVEVTTYRVDGGYSDGRHPDSVRFTDELTQDLARRDFTVNAMALSPKGELVDPFGGRDDLGRRLLRAVGEPAHRFEEDALRILRALRFGSVLGFAIEADTARAVHECRALLERVSAERIAAELVRLLCGQDAREILLEYPDVLGVFVPELLPMVGFEQRSKYHLYDVYTHTVEALAAVRPVPVLRLSLLLHDVGKPETFTLGRDGAGHFYGHALRGSEMARDILRRLRFDNETVDTVCELILSHDIPIERSERAVRRWLGRLGEKRLRLLLEVKRADNAAHAPGVSSRAQQLDEVESILARVLEQGACFCLRDLAVKGGDLIALGIPPGPGLGALLQKLLDAVIEGRCQNERDVLLGYAEELRSQTP